MLYVICGTAYNYFVLGIRGFDVMPRYSLCSLSDTVDFLRDWTDSVKSYSSDRNQYGGEGWRDNWGSGSGRYSGLASSREEEGEMVGGPPGLLDEEDEEEERVQERVGEGTGRSDCDLVTK